MSETPSLQLNYLTQNPMNWPTEVLPIFERALTCEFATLTRQFTPITTPLSVYPGTDEKTLDISTGVTYPAKAERARRNPKVALLFSDPVGSRLDHPPVVLVQGHAQVCDADIQGNTDRYITIMSQSTAFFRGRSPDDFRNLLYYLARIWIKVTPLRIFWWPAGETDEIPQIWQAPDDIQLLPSDPSPEGKQPPPWKQPEADWRPTAAHCVQHVGVPIVTTVDNDGYPLLMRTKQVTLTEQGFILTTPAGTPSDQSGPASLTFHVHPEELVQHENHTFVGQAIPGEQGTLVFNVERILADWSLRGMQDFISNGELVRPRLDHEMARRGQPIPTLHFSDDPE
jgi:Pyridoxamine 5'-phosphate oxidase